MRLRFERPTFGKYISAKIEPTAKRQDWSRTLSTLPPLPFFASQFYLEIYCAKQSEKVRKSIPIGQPLKKKRGTAVEFHSTVPRFFCAYKRAPANPAQKHSATLRVLSASQTFLFAPNSNFFPSRGRKASMIRAKSAGAANLANAAACETACRQRQIPPAMRQIRPPKGGDSPANPAKAGKIPPKWGYSDSNRGPPVCDTDALTN